MTIEAIIEQPFTDTELAEASRLKSEIDELLGSITSLERSLLQGWARLSSNLYEVREKKYWLEYGFNSFGKYIVEIGDKVGKGRSQLYMGVRIVEQLPEVSSEDLTQIGISKAAELCKIRSAGKAVPRELIERAKRSDVTIEEVRAEVFNTLHATPEERGKFFDLSGFPVTEDERLLLEHAIEVAKRTPPTVRHDIPEYMQKKECFIRFAMEYLSQYEDGQ